MTYALVRLQAKSVLRAIAAYVGEGAGALFFYAPAGGDLDLVFAGEPGGGDVLRGLARFVEAFAGPINLGSPRDLSLAWIAGCGGGRQFAGDGTPTRPALSNREVVAFFPFQSHDRRFVIPAYVMTRNLARAYLPSAPAGDPRRFDLPSETYRLAIDGIDTRAAAVTGLDPLTGAAVRTDIVYASPGRLVVEMELTDWPRLLVIEER